MAVVISLLRGLNLGNNKRVSMEALRALYESLGLRDPRTYINSGNVIFETDEGELAPLASRIEKAIEQTFPFQSAVILRTPAELRGVIRRNPFADRKGIDPSRLIVNFLAGDPGTQARRAVQNIKIEPEEMHVGKRELYIYYPNGMARPSLPMALIERTLKTPGTSRNWNTVTKLLVLAEERQKGPGEISTTEARNT